MKRIAIYAFMLMSLLYSCGQMELKEDGTSRYSRDSLLDLLGHYSYIGCHDSVIMTARPMIDEALEAGDTVTAFYAGVFTAQSFLFFENTDSIKYYIDRISPFYGNLDKETFNDRIIYNNVLGCYYLRTDLDYSRALSHFLEGLELARNAGYVNNTVAMLSNIVNIFYLQEDSLGYDYAAEAYKTAFSENSRNTYYKCVACVDMCGMLLLKGQTDLAEKYAVEAEMWCDSSEARSQYAIINLLNAEICERRGGMEKAAEYYRKAVDAADMADKGTVSNLCLRYGGFLERTGDYDRAMEMYQKGLELSRYNNTLEFKNNLIGCIADLSYRMGNMSMAGEFYRLYKVYMDSIYISREREFNLLILSNKDIMYQQEILVKELRLQESERRFIISSLIVVMVVMTMILVIVHYRRKQKIYKALVEQHRKYMQTLDKEKELKAGGVPSGRNTYGKDAEVRSGGDDADRMLFDRIERLMTEEKFYKNGDVSLESVAECLKTNRTYVSRAINIFSGKTFYGYIHKYRIEEATRQIVADPGHVLFKQLAYDLGYSSVSVFSRIFQREIGCTPSVYRKEVLASSSKIDPA